MPEALVDMILAVAGVLIRPENVQTDAKCWQPDHRYEGGGPQSQKLGRPYDRSPTSALCYIALTM